MDWIIRDPKRFLHERTEINKLVEETSWLKAAVWRLNSAVFEVDMDLEIHGKPVELTLTYPDVFPASPPYIRPRDSSQRLSAHQYGSGGSLCLEWRADNWDSRVTGADLIQSAHRLLDAEQNPDQPERVPSAHALTSGQVMRGSEYRLVCTPELLSALSASPAGQIMGLKTQKLLHSTTAVSFISQVKMVEGPFQSIKDLPSGIVSYFPLFSFSGNGHFLKSDLFDQLQPISSIEELRAVIRSAELVTDSAATSAQETERFQDCLIVLMGHEPENLHAFDVGKGDAPSFNEYAVVLPEKSSSRLPERYASLSKIRIGIVGMGSIGSKIAVSLARSGVRNFLLVDDDFLLPGNICRHELSWAAVGVHKASAVKEELSLIAPTMDVRIRTHRVAGQESALVAATTLKELKECNLLIDATANPEVFLRLAAIAKSAHRTLCWGELFAGGFGGLIARARPNVDPNPQAIRDGILQYFSTLPPAPHQQATGYDDNQQMLASDADVAQIASALTRLVLDSALQPDASEFPYSAYLIGLRKEWIFEQPFDTHPIKLAGEGWNVIDPTATDDDRQQAIDALLEIVAGEQHVKSDSAA